MGGTSPHLRPMPAWPHSPAGSATEVGVVGYTLGGGIGPVARTYGFAADHVIESRW